MIGGLVLRCVVATLLVVLLLAALSPLPATAQVADAICRATTPTAPPEVRYYLALSSGGKVVGAPVHAIDARFTDCQLARWNEPANPMRRMMAFVYNDSNRRIFKEARLTVWAEGVRAPVTSGPIPIGPKRTGVFLFVGPIERISLGGIYGGPRIRFEERAPPSTCGTFTLDETLGIIEKFDPGSTLRSRIPNLDPGSEVGVIRIQFNDSILQGSGTSQGKSERLLVPLYENRQEASFIECS